MGLWKGFDFLLVPLHYHLVWSVPMCPSSFRICLPFDSRAYGVNPQNVCLRLDLIVYGAYAPYMLAL